MTLKQENAALRDIIKNTFWMARRYAHGRNTYAPGMVRDAYKRIKTLSVDIGQPDTTLEAPKPDVLKGFVMREDYLDDCNELICPTKS